MPPSMLFRLRYSPILAQLVVIRRCNLACRYCFEYDDRSPPVETAVLEGRLHTLRELGTFGITLTGGEPTLHPDLPRLIRRCRELGFLRTGLISNGMRMTPSMIRALNEAGLQELQISIDGVRPNATTEKVLDRLRTRLEWLRDEARFHITVSGVIGACPPDEAEEIVDFAARLGFTPRLGVMTDEQGQVRLRPDELAAWRRITRRLPRTWMDFRGFRNELVATGRSPFKCRSGSRYLYVDEAGLVAWCSQTRSLWSRPLDTYRLEDLQEQFETAKPCQDSCAIGCVRQASQLDEWRPQPRTAPVG